jgi:hypothetical protein
MCSVTRIRRGLRRLPQLRRLLRNSGELFRRRRSSLAEGEHTIAFVSSIPFRFAVQSTVSWSFPSNPLCLLFLCLYRSSRRLPSAAAVLDSAASSSSPPVSTPTRSPRPPLYVQSLGRTLARPHRQRPEHQERLSSLPPVRPSQEGWR